VSTVILRTATRLVIPIVIVVSIALFLQGHNAPGGGFIAGVLSAAGLALIYIAYGLDFLEEDVLGREGGGGREESHIRHGVVDDYRRLFAVGLALAAGSGVASIVVAPALYGYRGNFMEQGFLKLHDLPLFGEMELASAVVFDLGVYLVVVGALLTVLSVVGAE
jgi:multicomponent Na+:H+ antiporter subunit B